MTMVLSRKLLSRPQRLLLFEKLLDTFYYLRDSELPQVESEVLLGGEKLFIDRSPPDRGSVTEREAIIIARLVRQRDPGAVFEIGTFNGRTTLNIAMNCSAKSRIFTLDLPREMIDQTKFKAEVHEQEFIDKTQSGLAFLGKDKVKDQVVQLYGDSATFDYSNYAGNMDFVFVDGAHSYDYVVSNSRTALQLLKPTGGAILWHDYNSITYTGVTRALNDLRRNDEPFKDIVLLRGTSLALLVRDQRLALRRGLFGPDPAVPDRTRGGA